MASSENEKRDGDTSAGAEADNRLVAAPDQGPEETEAPLLESPETPGTPGAGEKAPDLHDEALPEPPAETPKLELPDEESDDTPPDPAPQDVIHGPRLAEAEPVTTSQATAPHHEDNGRKRGSIFLPLVFGGLIAAGAGFGTAYWMEQNAGDLDPATSEQSQTELLTVLQAQSERLAALESQLAEAEPDLSGVEEGQQALLNQLSALEARLAEIEDRPVEAAPPDLSALEQQLSEVRALIAEAQRNAEAMRADADAIRAEAEETAAAARAEAEETAAAARAEAEEAAASARAEAEETASRAEQRAALREIEAAIQSGDSYRFALDTLWAAEIAVPGTLVSQAEGIPTLAEVQRQYPPAAREALAASLQATAAGEPVERIGSFLRSQFGVRSLAPREGNDPDAVLSRAEAAVAEGNLQAALRELDALPQPGRAAMAGWIELAQQRIAAIEALEALSNNITPS